MQNCHLLRFLYQFLVCLTACAPFLTHGIPGLVACYMIMRAVLLIFAAR